MGQGAETSGEWLLVDGRQRRWMWIFIGVLATVLIVRVARGIWVGGDWSTLIHLPFPVVAVLFGITQVRPRTCASDDGLLVRGEFSRERLIPWSDVQEIGAEGGRWATAVTAKLADGQSVRLPGVTPDDLDSVLAARPG